MMHLLNPLRGISPDLVTSTPKWCQDHVYVSPRVPTARPGQWAPDTVAALCAPGGPLEALDSREVETVVVMKGAQTAMTTTAYCWLAKELTNDPGSALLVMSSTQDARDKAAETWRPLWEDSPRMSKHLPDNHKRDWTKLYQLLNRSPVYWVGANSPGRLASKPIRRLILDEVDKYPSGFGRGSKDRRLAKSASEAGALELAVQRTKTFRQNGLAKILQFSTPTDERGPIAQAYAVGDQRKFYVPCPHCGHEQVMIWSSFKLDMALAETDPAAAAAGAHYACTSCGKAWTDGDRFAAIDRGQWRATAKAKDPLCRSYHMPSWTSKFVTHAYLATQWMRTLGNKSALQDFINAEAGEPFQHYENAVADKAFLALEGDYVEGESFAVVPAYKKTYAETEAITIIGCDVQKGYLVPVVRQFVRGGDSGLIWAGDCANFAALDALAEKYGAQYVFPDMRYRGREVQEWSHAHPGYVPCMGVTTRARSLFTVGQLDIDEGRRSGGGRDICWLSFDSDMLQDILVDQIQRREGSHRWMIPRGYAINADYVAQMTAERSVNGRWVNPGDRPNHMGDAERLALLGAIWLGYFPVSAA